MKFIILDFLSKKIPVKYSLCKNELDTGDSFLLFGKYNTKIILSKTLTNKINITFVFEDLKSKYDIDKLLFHQYGIPQYVKYGESYVWKINNVYVYHGEEDRYCHGSEHIINITFNKPRKWMADYSTFHRYNESIESCISAWNLKEKTRFIDDSGKFLYFYVTTKFRYIFILSKNKIKMEVHEFLNPNLRVKESIQWKQNQKFKDLNQLDAIINSFLSYTEEYDSDLHQIK